VNYAFIAAHTGDHAVSRMCQALQVSTSGYYAWRSRKPSQREQANERLLTAIRRVHRAAGERMAVRVFRRP